MPKQLNLQERTILQSLSKAGTAQPKLPASKQVSSPALGSPSAALSGNRATSRAPKAAPETEAEAEAKAATEPENSDSVDDQLTLRARRVQFV